MTRERSWQRTSRSRSTTSSRERCSRRRSRSRSVWRSPPPITRRSSRSPLDRAARWSTTASPRRFSPVSKRRGLPERAQMRHDSHFVDQLSRADELPIGRKIAIHLIEANPDQPRSNLGDLSGLKASIAQRGVLEPILVRKRDDGRFTIISGERRFRASMEAGLSEIPCIEMDAEGSDLLEIALIENLQRKDLTPFEEADGYAALQFRYGYTHEQIAKSVGKSRVTVT